MRLSLITAAFSALTLFLSDIIGRLPLPALVVCSITSLVLLVIAILILRAAFRSADNITAKPQRRYHITIVTSDFPDPGPADRSLSNLFRIQNNGDLIPYRNNHPKATDFRDPSDY